MSILGLLGLKSLGAYCFYTVGKASAVLVGVKCKAGQSPVVPERIGKYIVRGIDSPLESFPIKRAYSALDEKKQQQIIKKLMTYRPVAELDPNQLPQTVEFIGHSAANASANSKYTLQIPSHIHYIRSLSPGYHVQTLIVPTSLIYLGAIRSRFLHKVTYEGVEVSSVPFHSLSDYLQCPMEQIPQLGSNTFTECPALRIIQLSDRIEKIPKGTMPPMTPSDSILFIPPNQSYELHIPRSLRDFEAEEFRAAVVKKLIYPDDLNEAFRCRTFPLQKVSHLVIRDSGELEQYTRLLKQGQDPESFPDKCLYHLIRRAEHITLPASQKRIFDGMFAGCRDLSRVSVEPETSAIEEIGNDAFYGCNRLIPEQLLSAVRHIGDRAFQGCQVYKLILPEGLEHIGTQAFAHCSKLKLLSLPSTLKHLASDAFLNCPDLRLTPQVLQRLEAFPQAREKMVAPWQQMVCDFLEAGIKRLKAGVTITNKQAAYDQYRKALDFDPFCLKAMYRLERLLLDTRIPHGITVNELEDLREFLSEQHSTDAVAMLDSMLDTLDDMCVILSDSDNIITQRLVYGINCDQFAAGQLVKFLLDMVESHPKITDTARYTIHTIVNQILCTHTRNRTQESQKLFDEMKQRAKMMLGNGCFLPNKYSEITKLSSDKLMERARQELAKTDDMAFYNAEFWIDLARSFNPSVKIPEEFTKKKAMYQAKKHTQPRVIIPDIPSSPVFPTYSPPTYSEPETDPYVMDELVSEYWAGVAARQAAAEIESLWCDLSDMGFWDDTSWQ